MSKSGDAGPRHECLALLYTEAAYLVFILTLGTADVSENFHRIPSL
jgi:hypothetical protein